jgi:hypothetical protein
MHYVNKMACIVFILSIYLIGCQRNKLQDKIVENEIIDETSNTTGIMDKTSLSTGIVEVSWENDFNLLEEFELIPLEEDEGLKLEVEYSREENTLDTFVIYTTKGREFFRFQEKSFNQLDKSIKHFGYEGDIPKGIFFPYRDTSGIYSSGDIYYHRREAFCFADGKNGRVKLFSTNPYGLFEIDNSASYLCIGRSPGVPTVTIYSIETGDGIKKVVYEPYRDRAMFPIEINYKDGAFIVHISADTDEFVLLKIPINGGYDNQVIDSFSYR